MKTSPKNILISIGFYGTLLFGLLSHFIKSDLSPPAMDTTPKAGKPTISGKLEAIGKFTSEFDKWYLQNFPYRNFFLWAVTHFRNIVLATPSSDSVIFGKNNHLFFTGQNNIESFRNISTFQDNEISALIDKLEQRGIRLKKRGIRYQIVVAPDPHTIYSENLPKWIAKAQPRSRLDQLVEASQGNKHFSLVDLRPVLREAKNKWRLYHLTDTHWNDIGAFLCYRTLVEKAAQLYDDEGIKASLRPLDLEKDYFIKRKRLRGGDLANMLGLSNDIQEDVFELEKKSPSLVRVLEDGDPKYSELRKQLIEAGGFTSEQSKNFTTINPQIGPKLRALVFRDSYFSSVTQFLSENFHKVKYVWNNGVFVEKEIETFHPNLVIQEVVERSFHSNL